MAALNLAPSFERRKVKFWICGTLAQSGRNLLEISKIGEKLTKTQIKLHKNLFYG